MYTYTNYFYNELHTLVKHTYVYLRICRASMHVHVHVCTDWTRSLFLFLDMYTYVYTHELLLRWIAYLGETYVCIPRYLPCFYYSKHLCTCVPWLSATSFAGHGDSYVHPPAFFPLPLRESAWPASRLLLCYICACCSLMLHLYEYTLCVRHVCQLVIHNYYCAIYRIMCVHCTMHNVHHSHERG